MQIVDADPTPTFLANIAREAENAPLSRLLAWHARQLDVLEQNDRHETPHETAAREEVRRVLVKRLTEGS